MTVKINWSPGVHAQSHFPSSLLSADPTVSIAIQMTRFSAHEDNVKVLVEDGLPSEDPMGPTHGPTYGPTPYGPTPYGPTYGPIQNMPKSDRPKIQAQVQVHDRVHEQFHDQVDLVHDHVHEHVHDDHDQDHDHDHDHEHVNDHVNNHTRGRVNDHVNNHTHGRVNDRLHARVVSRSPEALVHPSSTEPVMSDPPGSTDLDIPSTYKEAKKLLQRLEQEKDSLEFDISKDKTRAFSLKVLERDILAINSELPKLTTRLNTLKEKAIPLEKELDEKTLLYSQLEKNQENLGNIDNLRNIAHHQMLQISKLRGQVALQIASRNEKNHSVAIYEHDKIPSIKDDCEAFKETQVSLQSYHARLVEDVDELSDRKPVNQKRIAQLEKLIAMRILEAQIHQVDRTATLEQINIHWGDVHDWFETEVVQAFATMDDYLKEFEDLKRMSVGYYGDYKDWLKKEYSLESWS